MNNPAYNAGDDNKLLNPERVQWKFNSFRVAVKSHIFFAGCTGVIQIKSLRDLEYFAD